MKIKSSASFKAISPVSSVFVEEITTFVGLFLI